MLAILGVVLGHRLVMTAVALLTLGSLQGVPTAPGRPEWIMSAFRGRPSARPRRP
ncbi:hypothetical protein ABZ806_06705 [Spirillospora sp. NPDC047418]